MPNGQPIDGAEVAPSVEEPRAATRPRRAHPNILRAKDIVIPESDPASRNGARVPNGSLGFCPNCLANMGGLCCIHCGTLVNND